MKRCFTGEPFAAVIVPHALDLSPGNGGLLLRELADIRKSLPPHCWPFPIANSLVI